MRVSLNCLKLIGSLLIAYCVSSCTQATTDTLVFGERTGVNIGAIVDPGKTTPIELNTGFRRQVIGVIPPSQVDSQGRPAGEAANMASHFEIKQVVDQNGNPLNGGLAMRGGFMSGGAASGFFENADSATANAVANKLAQSEIVTVRAPSDPEQLKVVEEIVALIESDPAKYAPAYLTRARARSIQVFEGSSDRASAQLTATQEGVSSRNLAILGELKSL